VGFGGEFDHFLIFFEMAKVKGKPSIHFKFYPSYIEEEDFVNLIKDNWSPLDGVRSESASIQFVENLKKIKYKVVA
jgi:hypothetical protein